MSFDLEKWIMADVNPSPHKGQVCFDGGLIQGRREGFSKCKEILLAEVLEAIKPYRRSMFNSNMSAPGIAVLESDIEEVITKLGAR